MLCTEKGRRSSERIYVLVCMYSNNMRIFHNAVILCHKHAVWF